MATQALKVKKADVSFHKAFRSPDYGTGFTGIVYHDMLSPLARKVIEFTTLDELKTKVHETGFTLSHEHGHGVAAIVGMARGERSPNGFDKWLRQQNFTYNLTEEPKYTPPPPTPEQLEAQKRADERAKEPSEYIDVVQTAQLIRQRLKEKFPGTKFSVRTDKYAGGASIRIKYKDGPKEKDVEAIAQQYQGKGFDGMIDMAYYYDHWLLPDGSTQIAYTPGTEGSRGVYEAIENPKPHPDAKKVHFGSSYVFVNREYSNDVVNERIRKIAKEYGEDPEAAVADKYKYESALTTKMRQHGRNHVNAPYYEACRELQDEDDRGTSNGME